MLFYLLCHFDVNIFLIYINLFQTAIFVKYSFKLSCLTVSHVYIIITVVRQILKQFLLVERIHYANYVRHKWTIRNKLLVKFTAQLFPSNVVFIISQEKVSPERLSGLSIFITLTFQAYAKARIHIVYHRFQLECFR